MIKLNRNEAPLWVKPSLVSSVTIEDHDIRDKHGKKLPMLTTLVVVDGQRYFVSETVEEVLEKTKEKP